MTGIIALITAILSWLLLRTRGQTADPAILIHHRFCKKLSKQGLIKNPGEGAQDFATRAKQHLPEHSASIERITKLFIKLRYGKQSDKSDFLQRLTRLVAKFNYKAREQ
jgi:hypothetical protein